MAKLPTPDPDQIAATTLDLVDEVRPVWRLHRPDGAHPLEWNELRHVGALRSARFDPWLEFGLDRLADPRTTGVGYFGFDIPTCLAEVFQDTRHIDTHAKGDLRLSAFVPDRSLSLLDLRGGWPIQAGASHQINSGHKDRCRMWAHAIRQAATPDGFLYTGMAGRDAAVLFSPETTDGLPATHAGTWRLADPALASRLADAAEQIRYTVS